MTRRRKRSIWILLGILTIFLLRLGKRHPQALEYVYGEGIYPAIRIFFSLTTGWLPFPALTLVVILSAILLYRTAIIPLRRNTWSWSSLVGGVFSTSGAIIFLFYALWGFNYGRQSIASRMSIDAVPLDSSALLAEFRFATDDLVKWATLHEKEIRMSMTTLNPNVEESLNAGLLPVLQEAGFPMSKTPRGRLIRPKGILLRFSTAGIYIPFSGEGHVDAGILPFQVPFTMTHELAHGYGVTDEGECNFLAYLACSQSEDPVIRYSALLGYWRYVAFDFRRHYRDKYTVLYETMPDLVKETMTAISKNNEKYPDIMPRMRNAVYDSYLRSNGIAEGLVSYNRVVRMVYAYRGR
jgi:uncharacterized protein DUF3810